MTSPAETAALVEGIDVDAVAAAVRSCPAVDDLDSGLPGGAVTYLPGRRVPGIRIGADRIEVHVRAVWNQPVGRVADQIRQSLASLAGGRPVDVTLTDIAEPESDIPAVPPDGRVEAWTRPSAPGGLSDASSSAPTIQTAAEIRPSS